MQWSQWSFCSLHVLRYSEHEKNLKKQDGCTYFVTCPNFRPHAVRLFAFRWSLTGSSTVHIFGHASGILADFAAANDIIANLAKTTEPVIEIYRRCSSNFIFVVWNVWYDARETYFFKHEFVILSFRCNFLTEYQSEEGRTIGIINKINETTVTKPL